MPIRILLDQNAPIGLRRALASHEVVISRDLGWERLANGDLIRSAEQAGFTILITCDRNIRYQQNLSGRRIALIELTNGLWPVVRNHLDRIVAAVEAADPGGYTIITLPLPPLRRRPYPRLER
ncbi:MAG TPA: hypothetical protein VGG99_07775 [Acetobacteraceae bacterium]